MGALTVGAFEPERFCGCRWPRWAIRPRWQGCATTCRWPVPAPAVPGRCCCCWRWPRPDRHRHQDLQGRRRADAPGRWFHRHRRFSSQRPSEQIAASRWVPSQAVVRMPNTHWGMAVSACMGHGRSQPWSACAALASPGLGFSASGSTNHCESSATPPGCRRVARGVETPRYASPRSGLLPASVRWFPSWP